MDSAELGRVYNRLQESHKIIGELVSLLEEHIDCDPDEHSDDYLDDLNDRARDALSKYGDINGD